MSNNTYPDGFPKEPLAAIEASYFLSDAEKTEWRNWLPTANETEKAEFVETLHSIFIDQQNQAPAPTPTETTPPPIPAIPEPVSIPETVTPVSEPLPLEQVQETVNQNIPNPVAETLPVQNSNVFGPGAAPQEPPVQADDSDSFDFDFSDLEAELQALENPQPTPVPQAPVQPQIQPSPVMPDPVVSTPVVEQPSPVMPALNPEPQFIQEPVAQVPQTTTPQDPFSLQEAPQEVVTPSPETPQRSGVVLKKPAGYQQQAPAPQYAAPSTPDPLKDEVDTMFGDNDATIDAVEPDFLKKNDERYEKVAQISLLSAKQVSELYNTFLDTQTRSSRLEQEYQERQANLFDKIMEMVTEASVLSDKVLRLNDTVTNHAGEIDTLKSATSVRGSVSLQSQLNSVKEEVRKVERSLGYAIESVERQVNDMQSEFSSRIDAMSRQITAALADTYKVDGTHEKFAKIIARLELLEGGSSDKEFEVKTPRSKKIVKEEGDTKPKKVRSKSTLSLKEIKKSTTEE